MHMMSDSSGSIDITDFHARDGGNSNRHAPWHSKLFGGVDAHLMPPEEPNNQVEVSRARRPSQLEGGALTTPLRSTETIGDSSIRFDVEPSGNSLVGKSSIEFEVIPSASVTQNNDNSVRVRESTHHHRGGGGGVAATKKSKPAADSNANGGTTALVRKSTYQDPLQRLYHVGLDRKLAKQQWACLERAKRAQLDLINDACTFQPELSPHSRAINRPRSLSPQFRANSEMQRKTAWRAKQKSEAQQREMAECTFKPLTLSAAKLHASALIRRAELHDHLHADHKTRQKYRDEIQMKAVEVIEKRVMYRQNCEAGTNTDVDLGLYSRPSSVNQQVLSKEEVNEIVERLLHGSIRHGDDDPIVRGETFRPTINPTSAKIALQAREKMQQRADDDIGDDDERHTRNTKSATRSEEVVGEMRARIAFERRKQHAELLFNLLAEQSFEMTRAKIGREDPQAPSAAPDEALLSQCELSSEALRHAAGMLFPTSSSLFEDIDRALRACVRQNVSKISRKNFVVSLLSYTPFTSVDVIPRPVRASRARSSSTDDGNVKVRSHSGDKVDHQAVVERLLRRQRIHDQRLKEERAQIHQEEEAQRKVQCTFKPKISSYAGARSASAAAAATASSKHRTATATASSAVKGGPPHSSSAAPSQILGVADDRDTAASSKWSYCNADAPVEEPPHHVLPPHEAALVPQGTGYRSHPQPHPNTKIRAGSLEHTFPSGVYRDVISEHAALGPPNVLKELGTLLMRRQMNER